MPQLGEVKHGREIGKNQPYQKYIWLSCPQCGKARWSVYVKFRKGVPPFERRCLSCGHRGSKAGGWSGGRTKEKSGYITLCIQPEDFFFPTAHKKGRNSFVILEHRLVMAKYLGRNLHLWEVVHHKNHIRDDNCIENLQLVTDERHQQITILENEIAYWRNLVTKLKEENAQLR